MTHEHNNKGSVEGLIDPTTCSTVIYSDEEREFMTAMDRYKRENKRPFPNCSEVLAVLKSLGYRKVEGSSCLPKFNKSNGGYAFRSKTDRNGKATAI